MPGGIGRPMQRRRPRPFVAGRCGIGQRGARIRTCPACRPPDRTFPNARLRASRRWCAGGSSSASALCPAVRQGACADYSAASSRVPPSHAVTAHSASGGSARSSSTWSAGTRRTPSIWAGWPPPLFSEVPVVFHELVDERQRMMMMMMGLHHITGKRCKRIPVIMRLQAHCERTAVRGNGTHTLSTRSSPSPILHGSPATAVTGYVEPAGRRRRSRRKGSLKGPQAPCLTSRLPITIRDDRALRGGARVASSFNE